MAFAARGTIGRSAVLAAIWLAHALYADGEQLPLRTYTTAADGLGSSLVQRIVRDSRGFLRQHGKLDVDHQRHVLSRSFETSSSAGAAPMAAPATSSAVAFEGRQFLQIART
jgi:hypothetical protein